MHLSLASLKAHLVMMAAQAKTEAKGIVHDVIQAVHNLEAKAEDLGNPLTLFESHGYGLDEAKRLVEVFENRAKQVVQHVEEDLGLKPGSTTETPPVMTDAVAGNGSTETPPAGNVAEGSTDAPKDTPDSAPEGGGEGQQGGEGQ